MRTALIGFLMAATMVTPVAAQAQSGGFSSRVRAAVQDENREERRQQRTERRQERQEQRQTRRAERQQATPRQDVRVQNHERRQDRQTRQERPRTWAGAVDQAIVREQREERIERRQDRRDWRNDRRADRRDWNRNWRNDRRYDWQRYRNYNRGLFNIGRYYSPYYGHNYSRFSIGFRLGSSFYSDRYWIREPWQYRLPAAYAGTRWVRYYDDVLLVDLYTGEVVDVIYNFFW